MSSEEFANNIMRTAVGVLCQAIGWNSAQTSTIDILADLMKRHLIQVAKKSHRYAEHFGRSEANFDDAALAFRDMGISIAELEEYIQNFDPVPIPFPREVPLFPRPKLSSLNFLRPGSQEVLTRPVHVHEYMPPMILPDEKEVPPAAKDKEDKKENSVEECQEATDQNEVKEPEVESNGVEVVEKEVITVKTEVDAMFEESEKDLEKEIREAALPEKVNTDESECKIENGINNFVKEEGEIDQNSDVEDEISESPQASGIGFTPFSNLTPKTSKRLESPGENPALKRVRMMLEEEGHPLREITSVIMTTSGYLSSSREGRLPDTKPPANRDFFEPAPPPPVEKKKKIPTMKKIVEGVKKIEREKDNAAENEEEATFSLFENPDKILPSASSAPGTENEAKLKLPKAIVKVKKIKVKKEKTLKVAKIADKLVKKATKPHDKDKEKQKLKIFKKKLLKNKQDEKALKRAKKLKLKAEAAELRVKVSAPKKIEKIDGNGLDAIESDEDFGVEPMPTTSTAVLTPIVISPLKKARKKKEKLLPKVPKLKPPKLDFILKKNKPIPGPPPMIPMPKMSAATKEKLILEAVQDKFSGIIQPMPLIGAQKKKRGRPKKNVMMPGFGLSKEPPLKIMKIRKEHMEPDINKLIPDISINVKQSIQTPSFDLLMRLPSQPGLIPTSFVNAPSLRIPNQLPSSISITPAVSSTPTTPTKESRNQQFNNLPPNVCSSVTITRIDMSHSQKLPTPFDNSNTPGIGSPNLSGGSANSSTNNTPASSKGSSSSLPMPIQADSASGITITPIVMDKPEGRQEKPEKAEKPEKPDKSEKFEKSEKSEKEVKDKPKSSALSKLEADMKTQKKREKEKRKELKKEKKKEKKEKLKEKERKGKTEIKLEKPEKKEKKDKSEKKKKKDKVKEPVPVPPAVVPKLTLKLNHSNATTPVDSPNPPQITIGGNEDVPSTPTVPPKKITFKPMEEIVKKRTPSPELARFSPLITRPPKPSRAAATKSAIASKAVLTSQEVVSFPPVMGAGAGPGTGAGAGGNSSLKRGPGRPPKSGRGPGRPPKPSQSGLVTETVGFYIDDQGNKVWICPACGRQDDGSPMIGCDTCDDWYHFTCVGIVDTPDETESWFCNRCMKKKKSSSGSGFEQKIKKKIPKV